MAMRSEKGQWKRLLNSPGAEDTGHKRLRTGAADGPSTPLKTLNGAFPSPVTHPASSRTSRSNNGIVTPDSAPNSDDGLCTSGNCPVETSEHTSPSSPSDTQPYPPPQRKSSQLSRVEDEEGEGVWGYLVPADDRLGDQLALRKRSACPVPPFHPIQPGAAVVRKGALEDQEHKYEQKKEEGTPAGGYLIGRHPECDRVIKHPLTISNRHCLLFLEHKSNGAVAVLEDLSSNGTFVNGKLVGRNKRRELRQADRIGITNEASFLFYYPLGKDPVPSFAQLYTIEEPLGRGHFASVHLCIENASGMRFAVKRFDKGGSASERSKVEGLQQEIAVLMSVSHPSLLCLKDTFDETEAVYLVLQLAPVGELFNWIVRKKKLTEEEARRVFVQLFQGVKYLHERNIVHRDIKPENILLVDDKLNVKLADFGLSKIVGEVSFTSTLCGTPSYVAPEILETSDHRRYTRAIDVWSLGVVLYICLCGFPPFSDEIWTPQNPYGLSEQIKLGRFDYPSPYWDSVGDPALDLIDRMLTVDPHRRISIDECLEHPWTRNACDTKRGVDTTDGSAAAVHNLDFSRRKVKRERTLLSDINDVRVTKILDLPNDSPQLLVYEKNSGACSQLGVNAHRAPKVMREDTPSKTRGVQEFMGRGGKDDDALFGNETSIYPGA